MPRYQTAPLLTVLGSVTTTLSKIPEPISSSILQILDEILKVVQQTSDNKNQLHLLFVRVCDILQSLQIPQAFTNDDSLRKSADQLIQNLESIRDFAVSTKTKNFFKAMIQADDIRFKIEELERRLWSSCLAFQNSALITANKKLDDLWELASNSDRNRISEAQLHEAQLRDQKEQLGRIQAALESLSKPSPDTRPLDTLLETLNVNPVVTMTGMSALLERHELGRIELRDEEVKFLKAGISRLKEQSSAASVTKIKAWTVTSLEVEKGFLLGWDTTSFVRTGRWLGKRVGLIEVANEEVVHYFVKMWKNLRSNRIQGLLGASTVDQPPFLLVPHPNLGIVEYVRRGFRKTKYLRLFLEAARSIEYLHTRDPPVVHGGVCDTSITVDEEGDVSLSSVGITPHHLAISDEQRRELNDSMMRWYAPEIRNEANPSFTQASDVFALGVVFLDILAAVADLRKPHPMLLENRRLVEELIEQCTSKDPSSRPTVSQVAEHLQRKCSNVATTDLMAVVPSSRDADLPDGLQNSDRWRVAYFSNKVAQLARDPDRNIRYVASAPLPGSSEHPLRQLCIEVQCHDQGKEKTTARQRDGAWAWVELSLHRAHPDGTRYQVNLAEELKGHPRGFMVDDTRYEIVRCPFADETPRVHRITLDHRNPFIKAAQRGDVVVLNPRARFPGWFIVIHSAEMQVVTE
ncbi:hypothetical protein Moror_4186 [Moniliophthora roreri MCA 2997]|uniref:Protein kinase domain-containing protein n=2 Tax=Moniliophthora roreri TaxID=221103 RepID=V2XA81_MONRO|nr:hypothetical protein Moror_4186 [Moniliophthora roreri MCA 2997]